MDRINETIALYHNLLLLCLLLCFLCLLTAIVLFRKLDMVTALHVFAGTHQNREKKEQFYVDREIVLVHTRETIQ